MRYHGKSQGVFYQDVKTASTPITAAAYTEVLSVANNTSGVRRMSIVNTSDQDLIVALGAASSEIDTMYIGKHSYSEDIFVSESMRISVKAALATTTTGELALTFWG